MNGQERLIQIHKQAVAKTSEIFSQKNITGADYLTALCRYTRTIIELVPGSVMFKDGSSHII